MEVRIVDVEHCGGAIVTVAGEMLASRVVEVKILPYSGSPPPPEMGQSDAAAPVNNGEATGDC